MQLGSDTNLLDALFVIEDPASGGLAAIDLASGERRRHVRVYCSTSASTRARARRSPSARSPSTAAGFRGR